MVGRRYRRPRQGAIIAARRHDRRPAIAGNGRPHRHRGAEKGTGAHPGAGAERPWRRRRPRTRLADGWRRLPHQAIRDCGTRRQGGSVVAQAGGIARAHVAGRPAESGETPLRVGPLELDLIERTAKRGDRVIDLLPREFRLLEYMMQRSDQLLTRAMLLEEVWNYKFVPATNLVDVHMGRLRHKVDGPDDSPMIHNVRGAGFILRTGS